MTSTPFRVVDLFAGPGGLAEGFAATRDESGHRAFELSLSIEKDEVAHKTLRLRSFLRKFGDSFPDRYYAFLNGEIDEPNWATEFPEQWCAAEKEAIHLELGAAGANEKLKPILAAVRSAADDRIVVIGGPPCQAYSIAGRARNKGNLKYRPEADKRHFLYREYIEILKRLKPVAFVMENVRGMLSATVSGEAIFEKVIADLSAIGGKKKKYDFYACALNAEGRAYLKPTKVGKEFLIYSEDYGVPQTRHRIILIGVRQDVAKSTAVQIPAADDGRRSLTTVRDVLAKLPKLRSGVSKKDSQETWQSAFKRSVAKVIAATDSSNDPNLKKINGLSRKLAEKLAASGAHSLRKSSKLGKCGPACSEELQKWILDPKLEKLSGHASRGHMESDLSRYFFAAIYASAFGRSPVANEFPSALAPKHKNWRTGVFSDRFRVQHWDSPSTTITSHIAKDGHYFIHPDPMQCRALTVREAARLQTFPDNYIFKGNQTQQYEQVGNAVPPFLARQIGEAVFKFLSGGKELEQPSRKPKQSLQRGAKRLANLSMP